MSPVRHWCEADYYRASRAAHRAWVASHYRAWIDGVLGQGDGTGTTSLVVPSPCPSPPSPTADAAPSRIPPQGGEGGLDKPKPQGGK